MKYLKSSNLFNSIDLESINLFLSVIDELREPRAEVVDKRYAEIKANGSSVLSFLLSLEIVHIKKEGSVLMYRSLQSDEEEISPESLVRHLEKHVHSFPVIIDYLSLFAMGSRDKAIFTGTVYQNVNFASIRNFFISCQVVYYDAFKDTYELNSKYLSLLKLKIIRKHSISKDALRIQLANKKIIGDLAEKSVFEYERNRLKREPLIMSQVELISENDETAGYDIRSFILNEDGIFMPIRIEVKAVPKNTYRFIWTENELNQSMEDSDSYYLYLLPVVRNRKLEINEMKIIKNPYNKLFVSNTNWTKRPQAYIMERKYKE